MSHLAARPLSAPQAAAAFNSLANRFLIPLLNSRAGARLGRRLAVVEYLGRRTGQHHQLVAIYVTEGQSVSITVGMAEHKTWWRNFATPRALRLRLAGVSHDAVAHVVRDGEHVRVVAELVPPAACCAITRPTTSSTRRSRRSVRGTGRAETLFRR